MSWTMQTTLGEFGWDDQPLFYGGPVGDLGGQMVAIATTDDGVVPGWGAMSYDPATWSTDEVTWRAVVEEYVVAMGGEVTERVGVPLFLVEPDPRPEDAPQA